MEVATGILKDAFMDKLLGPTALFAGGLVGVLRTVRSVVRESGVLERGLRRIASVQGIQGKFETLLRSATAAKRRIEELYRFTARSPFDFGDVAEANRVLEALTRGAYSGAKAMQTVGDMAAATGQTMSSAAEKVAKLHAALSSGRAFDKIAFQLQYAGVVTDELAGKLEALDAAGASFSSKWSEVEKVLARTGGGMKNEVETLDALRTRLDNANAAMAQAFGEPYVEAQVAAMKVMIAATENLTPVVAEIGRDFSVLPNFIRDAKTTLLDSVAAATGFANALRIAYRIAVSLFTGLAGATVVMAARNLTVMGQAALATAASMRVAYGAALAMTRAQQGLALASALATSAAKAFAAGSYLSAAALKTESVWIWAKTRALAANAAAARLAGSGTAQYSVGAHVANLATAGLAGAARLAGKGLGMLTGMLRGAAVAYVTNPWTAAATAILTVAAGLWKWSEAARAATEDARELADSIRETNKQLDIQAAAVKSITDWQTHLEKLRQRYNELTDAVVKFHRRVEQGEEPSREEISANEKNVAERRQVRAARDAELRRNTRNLGLSDRETDAIREDQANRRAARERDFRLALSNAQTPEARLALLESRKAELESRVHDGRTAKAGELDALRGGEAAFRTHLEVKRDGLITWFDQQKDLLEVRRDKAMEKAGGKKNAQGTWAGTTVPWDASEIYNEAEKKLRRLQGRRNAVVPQAEEDVRNVSLFSRSPTVRAQAALDEAIRKGSGPAKVEALTRALEDARAAVTGLTDAENELADLSAQLAQEERELGRSRAAQNLTNTYDARINEARRTGAPVGGIEWEKNLALAEVERNDAQTPEERQAAQSRIDAMHAEREAGRREVEVQRRRNAASARGDRKGAQAIDDAVTMREQIERYAALGLSEEDAKRDFRGSIIGEVTGRQPNVITDSLQSVGGGGGAYQGPSPIVAAQERATRAMEQLVRDSAALRGLLTDIRDSVRKDDE